ncbi:MAG: hypothetical protein LUF85_09230 [Bacteroides sp.]|nr:hypothetical protein [Bacteroides sp.]
MLGVTHLSFYNQKIIYYAQQKNKFPKTPQSQSTKDQKLRGKSAPQAAYRLFPERSQQKKAVTGSTPFLF